MTLPLALYSFAINKVMAGEMEIPMAPQMADIIQLT